MHVRLQFDGNYRRVRRKFPDRFQREMSSADQRGAKLLLQSVRESINDRMGHSERTKKREERLDTSYYVVVSSNKARATRTISLRSKAPHALIKDEGGTVTGNMAIPVSPSAKKVGRPRKFPGKLFRPKGKKFLATRGGAGGGLTVHYVLKQSVNVKGTKYISLTLDRSRSKIERVYDEALSRALN